MKENSRLKPSLLVSLVIASWRKIDGMKQIALILFLILLSLEPLQAQNPVPAPPQLGTTLITGVTIHIGNGKEIQEGAVGFKGGLIDFVGSAALAPKGYSEVIEAKGKHVYPGFITVNSALGLMEIDAVRASRDDREVGGMNPHVRSIIAYNTDSRITPTVRANGVLMGQIAPQGGRIAGSSSVVTFDAWNWEDAAYSIDEGIHVNWPALRKWDSKTRMRVPNADYEQEVKELRLFLERAKAYCSGYQKETQLREAACCGLFDGKQTLYVHSNRAPQMIRAINLAQDLGIDKLVIVGGYDAGLILDVLKDRNVAVMISEVHGLPARADDAINHTYKLAAQLSEAGILFCLENIKEMPEMNAMNLPFQAGTCVAYGLDKREAVSAMTLNTAKILGIDDRCGSIEVGKDATLFISTGDALDMRTNNVERAFIQGRDLDLDNHQKFLYRKFKAKYESMNQ
jgi:imidazolonepropionase-like amidohydrolase